MSLKSWSKKIEKKIQFQPIKGKKYLLEKGGYIADKRITSTALLCCFAFLFYMAAFVFHFDLTPKIYVSCPASGGPCENPYYLGGFIKPGCSGLMCNSPKFSNEAICHYDWCNWKMLPAGFEGGEKPPWIALHYDLIIGLIICVAFLLNHFLYNNHEVKQ